MTAIGYRAEFDWSFVVYVFMEFYHLLEFVYAVEMGRTTGLIRLSNLICPTVMVFCF